MEITTLGILLGLLLLAVPLGVAGAYGLGVGAKTLRAVASMVASMVASVGVLGGIVYFLTLRDSALLNVLFALLMIVVASAVAVGRARVSVRFYFLPVLAGVALSSVVVGMYFLFAVMGERSVLDVQYLVPVVGLLAAGSVLTCADALSAYHAGLHHHAQLYYYLLGNGATRAEALRYFVRRALLRCMIPGAKRMAVLGLAAAPTMMWPLLMADASVLTAASFQALMMIAMYSSSVMAVLIALVVSRRYNIDEYSHLKDPTPPAEPEPQPVETEQPADDDAE